LTARRHDSAVFRPRGEQLEAKILMAIDLGGTLPTINPNIASVPYGMDFSGPVSASTNTAPPGAGFSVADVGSLNGTGYDDLLVGAPSLSPTAAIPPATLGTGINAAAYLVFGSQTVNQTTVTDWIGQTNGVFNYTPDNRVSDLGQQISTTPAVQTNPITGVQAKFPFPGVKFVTLLNPLSMLGASVAGVRLSTASGAQGAILIGAPGAANSNNQTGSGRAYLIYGTPAAWTSLIGQTVNLDTPTLYPGLTIITFVNNSTYAGLGQLGFSVAGGSNFLGDGATNVILGAPNATVAPTSTTSPVPTATGVVYVFSMSSLVSLATGSVVDVSTFGQGSSTAVTLSGVSSGDRAGQSVADGGDVNGATGSVDDLLIGAPAAASSAGAAYLVYGGTSLPGRATSTNGVTYINLSLVGSTATGGVPGATITGPSGGSRTGYSVSSAGDFNNDGFGDILIGSPGFSGSTTTTNQGEVTLLYGAASTSSAYLTGTIPLSTIPTAIRSVVLTGANAGDMAGYALSFVGFINVGQPNPILIGAPGFNSNAGIAYLIPGRAGLTGTFSLANAEATPLSGLEFVLSTPSSPTGTPNFFGASVSSRFQDTSFTFDGDSLADFVVGAPGYDVTQDTNHFLSGGAMVVQSGLITLPIPTVNTVTTQIGVGTPFAPFNINATTPANLPIFVFGSLTTTPSFMPVLDINPATVKVNGVAFPAATLVQDPNTNNYLNGIPDAIITINPVSALGLKNGLNVITITGQTLATSPLPNFTWTGTATVNVTGGTVTPVVSAIGAPATGPVTETTFVSTFGANQYSPSLTALSAYNYQPIPLSVAMNEYLPTPGFRARIYLFNHPGAKINANRGQTSGQSGTFGGGKSRAVETLSNHVFNRSRFHAQKTYTWTHPKNKVGIISGVVPTQLTREGFKDNLISSPGTRNGTGGVAFH